jgi:hypothetical protein
VHLLAAPASLEQFPLKCGRARACHQVLENIIRSERRQREEEFHDMDANVRARDERVRELTEARPACPPRRPVRAQAPV